MSVGTRRGTTPTHTFTTNIDLSDAISIYITYSQDGSNLVEKSINDIDFGEMQISVKLTQADTLKFDDTCDVDMQIRAKFADGTAIASNVISIPVGEILKEGEI